MHLTWTRIARRKRRLNLRRPLDRAWLEKSTTEVHRARRTEEIFFYTRDFSRNLLIGLLDVHLPGFSISHLLSRFFSSLRNDMDCSLAGLTLQECESAPYNCSSYSGRR